MERSILMLAFVLLIACSDHQPQEKAISRDSLPLDSIHAVQQIPILDRRAVEQDSNALGSPLSDDEIQIEAYLKELNAKLIEAQDENTSFSVGTVHYSPDSLVKIYVLKGENCGMRCITVWTAYIHWQTNGRKRKQEVDFTAIDTIYRLPMEGKTPKYVVMQNSSYIYQAQGHYSLSANIISIDKNSLRFHPFVFDHTESGYNTFSVEQADGFADEPVLTYDPITSVFSYRYINNYLTCCEVDSDSLFEGSFLYDKGACRTIRKSAKFYR